MEWRERVQARAQGRGPERELAQGLARAVVVR
jgi:hypothetical protein